MVNALDPRAKPLIMFGMSNKKKRNCENYPISEVNELDQEDSHLISLIRDHLLIPPSSEPYNLKYPNKEPSMGQSQAIIHFFKNKSHGFFIECGALDGETRSNTLTMEKSLGWGGLLIEGDPLSHQALRNKNRKAWILQHCLSIKPQSMCVNYAPWGHIGKILPNDSSYKDGIDVMCFPLYSILMALKITEVDYFSLDVEGNELDILKTIPFDKIYIKTLSVEFSHLKEKGNDKSALLNFMTKKGYVIHKIVTHTLNLANDYIFIQRHLL